MGTTDQAPSDQMTLPLNNLPYTYYEQNALDEVADGECTEGQGGCRKRPINDGQHRCMAYLVSTHLAAQLMVSRILNPEL